TAGYRGPGALPRPAVGRGAPARRRTARRHGVRRRGHPRPVARAREADPDHGRRPDREPPARHPDDDRSAELPLAVECSVYFGGWSCGTWWRSVWARWPSAGITSTTSRSCRPGVPATWTTCRPGGSLTRTRSRFPAWRTR